MRGLWMFIHFAGFVAWMGAGLGAMTAGIVAKRFAPGERLAVYRVIGAMHGILVGPGAILVVLSGLLLAGPAMGEAGPPGWLVWMMLAGLLSALIVLILAVPAAAKLGRMSLDARGELPEAFGRVRQRLVLSSSIGGGLAIIALIAGTFR